jgi:hypothetical protein
MPGLDVLGASNRRFHCAPRLLDFQLTLGLQSNAEIVRFEQTAYLQNRRLCIGYTDFISSVGGNAKIISPIAS